MSSSSSTLLFQAFLLVSALLCTLTFGFVLLFSIVIMPGIGHLSDGEFLRAFQVMDGVIQNNEPVFVTTWIGAVLALVVTTGLGWAQRTTGTSSSSTHMILLSIACALFLVGQVTTFTLNVPLNNAVKDLEIHYLDASTKKRERIAFESQWIFWNWFRTVIFGLVSMYLLVLLLVQDSEF